MSFQLLLFKTNDSATDITNLCEQVKWKGRKGSSCRSVTAKLLDDDGYNHARSGIDVEEGHQIMLKVNGSEVFRGVIMATTQTNKKRLTFTAYDNGIYLANNKDTFCYTNKNATQIFNDVCSRFGLPTGTVASCSYTIPELTKAKTSAWDAIADALSLDFENTNVRHYVSSSKGKLSLLVRKENVMQWVIEPTANLISYSWTKSIEDVKTRIKLYSDEGVVLAQQNDAALEKKIGVFQDVDIPDETLTTAQITALAKSLLLQKKAAENTLSVEVLGNAEVISGIGVYIVIPHLGISKTYYVDEDTHTFEDNKHTMSLKLNIANDIGLPAEEKPQEQPKPKEIKKGDIVNFSGGVHYTASTDSKPVGGTRTAGRAWVQNIAPNAPHKYALIGGAYRSDVGGNSNVYGWVDASTVSST